MTTQERYISAMHGMQSGVAIDIHLNGEAEAGASPKHLRTGLNGTLRDQCSLVKLLIAKGILTQQEYEEAIADGAEEEKRFFEAKLTKQLDKPVRLG